MNNIDWKIIRYDGEADYLRLNFCWYQAYVEMYRKNKIGCLPFLIIHKHIYMACRVIWTVFYLLMPHERPGTYAYSRQSNYCWWLIAALPYDVNTKYHDIMIIINK